MVNTNIANAPRSDGRGIPSLYFFQEASLKFTNAFFQINASSWQLFRTSLECKIIKNDHDFFWPNCPVFVIMLWNLVFNFIYFLKFTRSK